MKAAAAARRPHRRKERIPPGPPKPPPHGFAAILRGPTTHTQPVIDLASYERAAHGRNTLS